MKKGDVLKNQDFQRYFMSEIEVVDATVIDLIGEFQALVTFGDETHLVDFSLVGTMRSRENRTPVVKEIMQHVILINSQVHYITKQLQPGVYQLNEGKRYAIAHTRSKRLVHKHCLTGRFQSTTIK